MHPFFAFHSLSPIHILKRIYWPRTIRAISHPRIQSCQDGNSLSWISRLNDPTTAWLKLEWGIKLIYVADLGNDCSCIDWSYALLVALRTTIMGIYASSKNENKAFQWKTLYCITGSCHMRVVWSIILCASVPSNEPGIDIIDSGDRKTEI